MGEQRVDRRRFLGSAARLGLAGSVAPGALLAACGGGESGGKTTISWAYWGSPDENQVNLRVKAAFEKANPDISVNVVWAPFSQYFQKIDSMFAGGQPPDVLFLTYIQKYAAEGVIEDLGPWIKKGGIDLNDYWPHFLDDMSYRGRLYGLQRDASIDVLYYNQDHLRAAGLSIPDRTWTWDTFRGALARLTRKSGSHVDRYGLAAEQGKYFIWLKELGSWWFDSPTNPTRCTLGDTRAIEALDFQAGLIKDGLMMPVTDQTQGGDQGVFQAGLASMIVQNASRIPGLNQQRNLRYGLAPVPKPADGTWAANAGGAGYAMGAGSKRKDAAWKLITWLQSRDGGQPLFAGTGELFPALRSVAQSNGYQKPPPPGKDSLAFMAQYAQTAAAALFPEWAELDGNIIEPGLQKVWAGEQTVSQAVPPLVQQVDVYLKQKGYPKSG
jgi:multiple sugar transport system substrate-binding protein